MPYIPNFVVPQSLSFIHLAGHEIHSCKTHAPNEGRVGALSSTEGSERERNQLTEATGQQINCIAVSSFPVAVSC